MDCYRFFWESNLSGCYDEQILRKGYAFLRQPFFSVSFRKLNVITSLGDEMVIMMVENYTSFQADEAKGIA